MWEWLLEPLDPTRGHLVGLATAWHGRAMALAWGALAPLAILIARFYKIVPGQDWPRELDNQFWWRAHWIGQSAVLVLTVIGVGLIFSTDRPLDLHGILGYAVLALVVAQVSMGRLRGTKGGPTAPADDGSPRGDHYDMTRWRLMFEATHKGLGYGLLVLAAAAILLGLWEANAARWMAIGLLVWWAALAAGSVHLQRQGRAIDTYQAIWGPSPDHPGNRLPAPGWGMRRIDDPETCDEQGTGDVRGAFDVRGD